MTNRVVTKLKKANSVEPDEMARTSCLIWIFIFSKTFFFYWSVELKRLKEKTHIYDHDGSMEKDDITTTIYVHAVKPKSLAM